MNKFLKYILIISMIILVFIQIACINSFEKEKNIKECNAENKLQSNKKGLKELSEELNCLKNKNILSANKIEDKWYIRLKIIGNKDELLNEIEKLKTYDISEYSINKNSEESSIIVQLSAKDNVKGY